MKYKKPRMGDLMEKNKAMMKKYRDRIERINKIYEFIKGEE